MKLILLSLLLTGISWGAGPRYFINPAITHSISIKSQTQKPLDWKVGDTNTYYVSYSLFAAEMIVVVKEINQEGIWVQQLMGDGQKKQVIDILYDQKNGKPKKIIVNGRPEPIPDPNNNEILEYSNEKVSVPAGFFDSHYLKLKDKQYGKIIFVWYNPEVSSMGGLLKYQDSSTTKITLKSFIRK